MDTLIRGPDRGLMGLVRGPVIDSDIWAPGGAGGLSSVQMTAHAPSSPTAPLGR